MKSDPSNKPEPATNYDGLKLVAPALYDSLSAVFKRWGLPFDSASPLPKKESLPSKEQE